MSQENVERVIDFFVAFNRDGVAAFRDYADPEIEWHEDPAFPEAGVYRGLEHVEQYAAQFLDEFSEIHYEPVETIESGDDVVVQLRITGIGRLSGAPVELTGWWVMTIRGGKTARCFAYLDRDRALEAVGLLE
jgi:ketosteroid isomerase-like protein